MPFGSGGRPSASVGVSPRPWTLSLFLTLFGPRMLRVPQLKPLPGQRFMPTRRPTP